MTLLTRLRGGARGVYGALTGTAKAREPEECPAGTVLMPGFGEVCLDELVLDPASGQLVFIDQAPDDVLIWDGAAGEWTTVDEYNRRQAERAERERIAQRTPEQERAERAERARRARGSIEATRAAAGIQRGGEEVYDALAEEWITEDEYSKRASRRAALAQVLARPGLTDLHLPNLANLSGMLVRLDEEGVAFVGDEPAAEVLATEDRDLLDMLREKMTKPAVRGPEARDEDSMRRRRLIWLALLASLVVLVVMKRRAAA